MDATPEQLNETFKGFGAITKDGIQVRSYRVGCLLNGSFEETCFTANFFEILIKFFFCSSRETVLAL